MAGMTRGKGLLEPLLADLRAQKANKLIPSNLRAGRILDIGCGSFPYFLAHTSFAEKFAIDQIPLPQQTAAELRIESFTLDLEQKPKLPFDDNFFEAVTLLAVVEHLDPRAHGHAVQRNLSRAQAQRSGHSHHTRRLV